MDGEFLRRQFRLRAVGDVFALDFGGYRQADGADLQGKRIGQDVVVLDRDDTDAFVEELVVAGSPCETNHNLGAIHVIW